MYERGAVGYDGVMVLRERSWNLDSMVHWYSAGDITHDYDREWALERLVKAFILGSGLDWNKVLKKAYKYYITGIQEDKGTILDIWGKT